MKLPPISTQIVNFSKAVVKHARNKFKKVDELIYRQRLEICNGCEFHSNGRCTHKACGCYLATKAWWASENCPIAKWPKLGV